MIIEKVLNNNVLLTKNDKGKEVIVMGRGISFKKVAGDPVDDHKIDKIFMLNENEFTARLTELLNDIPVSHLEVVNEIVTHAAEVLDTELSDNIYLTLTDHIHFAIQREEKGLALKNAMLYEIKRFYKKEFAVGLDALQKIENTLGVKLGEDEAGFIALHMVNARIDGNEMKATLKMTEIVQHILNIITYHYGIVLDESSFSYSRFLTHLQYFAMRVIRKEVIHSGEEFLYNQVKQTYTEAFACTQKINEYLEKTYDQYLSKDEYVYLTIHIHRVTERNNISG
ncbi:MULTISPECIES: PRD domain-containing protein [Paenibacillus]|uniref:Transcription antiterminator BglG n=1 Tax=Paenibacillus polymyxa (strain SC2) TaxID=886882 RepID=E3EA14_PAEPS|nr:MULTISPECIES: PRD domain-containing protein [Paenibacillus]ADO58147.1 transcription antiterminator BglG [Paenibacillus polymyxa SC2]AZH30857.1 PRD domain-containing protein [Paenibacillus sp. M-152]WPQ55833.1 PRD domain-containing protein [Paenibacillus polymyxa]CCI70741.1 Beta-glucoside operon antiterminator [Paenibacillus polymyxa M1]